MRRNIHRHLGTFRVVKPDLDVTCSGLHSFPEEGRKKKKKGKAEARRARDGSVTVIVEKVSTDVQLGG